LSVDAMTSINWCNI